MIRRNKEKPVFIMLVVLIAGYLSACEHVFAGEPVAAETVTGIQLDTSWHFSEITVPVGDGSQQSACCPAWCPYGIVDFLFLQRDNTLETLLHSC